MHEAKVNTISVELPLTGENINAGKSTLKAVHKPFSWLDDSLRSDRQAEFAATTFDICQGISLCIELVHSSDLERLHNVDADPGEEEAPLLDLVNTERLLRLARASAELLADSAERHIEWLNTAARRKQADASKGGAA
jgi:hypothetical protein